MTEAALQDEMSTLSDTTSGHSASAGPGSLLRQAREAQGLHLGALAVALKVPVKKLEALEADRYDQLPDLVFVRALAKSVCRTLKIDPDPIMAKLPERQVPKINADPVGRGASFRSGSGAGQNAQTLGASSPLVWLAVAMLLAIMAVYFWPASTEVSRVPLHGSSVSSDLPPPGQAQGPMVLPPASTVSSVAVQPVPPMQAASVETSAISVSSSASAPTDSKVPAVTDVSGSEPILTLQLRGDSWVEIRDAAGIVRVNRMASAGEVLQAGGGLPLSVILGRGDQVVVTVRGKPFSVAEFSKSNVARFEVR